MSSFIETSIVKQFEDSLIDLSIAVEMMNDLSIMCRFTKKVNYFENIFIAFSTILRQYFEIEIC